MTRLTSDGNTYVFRSTEAEPLLTHEAVETIEEAEAEEILVTHETASLSIYRLTLEDWLEHGYRTEEGIRIGAEDLRDIALSQSHEEGPADPRKDTATYRSTRQMYRCEECKTIYEELAEAESCCGGGLP